MKKSVNKKHTKQKNKSPNVSKNKNERFGVAPLNTKDLDVLKNESVTTCEKNNLVDLKEVKVNMRKNKFNRMQEFVDEIKNPYLFKVGDIVVKIEYCGDKNVTEAVANAIKAS